MDRVGSAIVLPYMASLIKKKKGGSLVYYLVTSARVDGKPRITRQVYLGTAKAIAKLFEQKAAPIPVEAAVLEFGLPVALWQAALRSGAFDALLDIWPRPRKKGPSIAHYLLLAAIHRICAPGPMTKVADWYQASALPRLWQLSKKHFTSQSFWNHFDRIDVSPTLDEAPDDQLEKAQSALLAAFRDKGLVGETVVAYDTTNFHTWTASTNERNKQKRSDLRQVGLSYALDGEHGLSLCHHVYPGNVSDSNELPCALQRLVRMLDRAGIGRGTVTVVMDKGNAALANTAELEQHGLNWVTALPWNQAPEALRSRPAKKLEPLGGRHPGVSAFAERALVHGGDYLWVVSHSAGFASEQLHSASTSLTRAVKALERLARDLRQSRRAHQRAALKRRIEGLLSRNFVSRCLSYELERGEDGWRLDYSVDYEALHALMAERFGRTTLVTNRLDWSAEQVVDAYGGQQHAERVFRGLEGGKWVGWGPMFHWTDSKIRVHAFYCMLGVSLMQYLRREAEKAWPGLSMESLKNELAGIKQVELLYPRLGDKGPLRTASAMSKANLPQTALQDALGLEEFMPKKKVG